MHQSYLQQALQLAETRRGFCAPNPSVAALIVVGDRVIASGVHLKAGQDHAEVAVLRNLPEGVDLSQATLYVTLEPCCHWGKTPPCVDAIRQSGIPHVVFGYQDPNPQVNGGGADQLNAAGIHCEFVYHPGIAQFYQSYHYWVRHRRPFVTTKLAMSLDAKIAGTSGEPLVITGKEAKTLTFYHRLHSDAILTTAKTVIADDPQLNIREPFETQYKPIYLLDRSLRTPLDAKVFVNPGKTTVFHSDQLSGKLVQSVAEQGHRCIAIAETDAGLDLLSIIEQMGADGVHDLWVEAGAHLVQGLLEQRLVQRALFYVAPKVLGEGLSAFDQNATCLSHAVKRSWTQCGEDAVLTVSFVDKVDQTVEA